MSLRDILKTDKIIRILPNESLHGALAKLSSSHDAAFVFSEDKKYLGVINPYYCLIKSSYPGNAKVAHCLYHAPRVRINYSLTKIAELFIESKIHYLPVFDEADHFLGIISARRLLSRLKGDLQFKVKIDELLKMKKKPLSVIFDEDTAATALALFKSTKFSKLVVTDRDLKLKGILSYFDLIYYLTLPKTSPQAGEREGDKISFYHHKVKTFMKSYVLTLTGDRLLSDALHLILTKKIGSVVILGEKKHPVGIITTRDLLRFFIQQSRPQFGGFLKHFRQMVHYLF
jgi:acetoin utilization protein AcuB